MSACIHQSTLQVLSSRLSSSINRLFKASLGCPGLLQCSLPSRMAPTTKHVCLHTINQLSKSCQAGSAAASTDSSKQASDVLGCCNALFPAEWRQQPKMSACIHQSTLQVLSSRLSSSINRLFKASLGCPGLLQCSLPSRMAPTTKMSACIHQSTLQVLSSRLRSSKKQPLQSKPRMSWAAAMLSSQPNGAKNQTCLPAYNQSTLQVLSSRLRSSKKQPLQSKPRMSWAAAMLSSQPNGANNQTCLPAYNQSTLQVLSSRLSSSINSFFKARLGCPGLECSLSSRAKQTCSPAYELLTLQVLASRLSSSINKLFKASLGCPGLLQCSLPSRMAPTTKNVRLHTSINSPSLVKQAQQQQKTASSKQASDVLGCCNALFPAEWRQQPNMSACIQSINSPSLVKQAQQQHQQPLQSKTRMSWAAMLSSQTSSTANIQK